MQSSHRRTSTSSCPVASARAIASARKAVPAATSGVGGSTGLGLAIVGRVLEDHGGGIELHDASDIRPGSRGAWMRLRFAISGKAANAGDKPNDEVTQSSDETAEPSEATNNQPKIEAATGN